MFQVQGKDLFAYVNGAKLGPFDLSGLLDLILGKKGSGSSAARRRALLQAPAIASLAFDGATLWIVINNGWAGGGNSGAPSAGVLPRLHRPYAAAHAPVRLQTGPAG